MTDIYNRINLPETFELNMQGDTYSYLHNLLIEESEAYLEIVFAETAPLEHIQKQAYIRGRIDLLKQLLNKDI